MYTYTISESEEIWNNSNSCSTLAITNTLTNETRTCADFTYFENETVEQAELENLFASM